MADQPDQEGVTEAVVNTNLGPPAADKGAPGTDLARAAARRIQAVNMRLAGATYEQIADQLGYHDKSSARAVILRALDRAESGTVNELRDIENARLERMHTAIWPLIIGQGVDTEDRLKAVDRLLRISERRSRLNGMDAPTQVAISAGVQADLEDAMAELREVVMGEVVDSATDESPSPGDSPEG